MREKYIVGNWKMNTDVHEGVHLVQEIVKQITTSNTTKVIVAPPFTSLSAVAAVVRDTPIKLAAQNVSAYESGSYTGEISAAMLTALEVSHVILGHSERRLFFHESNEEINKKALQSLSHNLNVILCIGETAEERNAGKLRSVIDTQLVGDLASVSSTQMAHLMIAYEPVWAIGTDKSASSADANEVHGMIRERIVELYGEEIAEKTVILYGGSVKPENAACLIQEEHVDGLLVGGASLVVDSFLRIIEAS